MFRAEYAWAARGQTLSSTVLIVEVEARRAEAFKRPLTEAGFNVIVAGEGLQALEAFQRARPDLVLIEAALPAPQGLELCRVLKETPEGLATPIVIAAEAHRGKSFRHLVLEYGCDEYLETPVPDERLIDCCRRLIAAKQQSDDLTSLAPGAGFLDSEMMEEALDQFDSLIGDGREGQRPMAAGSPPSSAREETHPPSSSNKSQSFLATLEELDRLADGLEQPESVERTRAAAPSSFDMRQSAQSLSETLEQLARVQEQFGMDPGQGQSPEIILGGDKGDDIDGHLEALFEGEFPDQAPVREIKPEAPPRVAADRSGAARESKLAPSPAAPALKQSPGTIALSQATHQAAKPHAPRRDFAYKPPGHVDKPLVQEPPAWARDSLENRGKGKRWTFACVLTLLGVCGGLWILWPQRATEQAQVPFQEFPVTDAPEPLPEQPRVAESGPDEPQLEQERPAIGEVTAVKEQAPTPGPELAPAAKAPAKPSRKLETQTGRAKPATRLPAAKATPGSAGSVDKGSSSSQSQALPFPSGQAPPAQAQEVPITGTFDTPGSPDSEMPPVQATPEPIPSSGPKAEPPPPPQVHDGTATEEPQALIPAYRAPVAIQRVQPAYPPRALKNGDRGTIVLKVLVSESGKVVRVVIEEGMPGSDLEAAAIDAVLRWQYRPAMQNGHTIRAWSSERFVFEPPATR